MKFISFLHHLSYWAGAERIKSAKETPIPRKAIHFMVVFLEYKSKFVISPVMILRPRGTKICTALSSGLFSGQLCSVNARSRENGTHTNSSSMDCDTVDGFTNWGSMINFHPNAFVPNGAGNRFSRAILFTAFEFNLVRAVPLANKTPVRMVYWCGKNKDDNRF